MSVRRTLHVTRMQSVMIQAVHSRVCAMKGTQEVEQSAQVRHKDVVASSLLYSILFIIRRCRRV